MSPKLALALSFLLASTAPVWAQSACGTAPFAPAMPTAADMKTKPANDSETALHDAVMDIKNWQGELKTYRACLDGQGTQAKNDMAGLDKDKDADKITALKEQKLSADHLYDQTVDQEEKVVNEYHAALTSYCMRADANKSKCPK